jgi:ubiquinone/menaquinone biosynthesis C-methylase UbiE
VSATADPYQGLSNVYDQHSHEEVSRAFLKAIRPMLRSMPPGAAVLDLGCATGLLTTRIAALGRPVIGVDRSRTMLRLARRRCAAHGSLVRFVAADFTALPPVPKCGLAVACCDVVNHIPSRALLARVFREAYRNLEDGGSLVFDALERSCFERYWVDQTYFMEADTGDVVMECEWNPRTSTGTVRMTVFRKMGRGRYAKRVVELKEYQYERGFLQRALRAAGFRNVRGRPWSPWSDQAREGAMDRTLWVATR